MCMNPSLQNRIELNCNLVVAFGHLMCNVQSFHRNEYSHGVPPRPLAVSTVKLRNDMDFKGHLPITSYHHLSRVHNPSRLPGEGSWRSRGSTVQHQSARSVNFNGLSLTCYGLDMFRDTAARTFWWISTQSSGRQHDANTQQIN